MPEVVGQLADHQASIPSPFVRRTGQSALTRFLPLDDEVQVEVTGVHVPAHLQEFVLACHKTTHAKSQIWSDAELLEHIGGGKTLGQCAEIVTFGVKSYNVSRTFTHQLVRARVGISFSQQCTGDVDSRHGDVLVPQCYFHPHRVAHLHDFMDRAADCKVHYCDAVDLAGISIQEARYILPAGLTSFIWGHVCLGALAELYNKRCCTSTQTWEMVVWARKLVKQVAEVAPWAMPLFRGCGGGFWYTRTIRTPFANTNLFAPDKPHDTFNWKESDFVHGTKRHEDVSSGPLGQPIHYYVDDNFTTKDAYDRRASEYGIVGNQ